MINEQVSADKLVVSEQSHETGTLKNSLLMKVREEFDFIQPITVFSESTLKKIKSFLSIYLSLFLNVNLGATKWCHYCGGHDL